MSVGRKGSIYRRFVGYGRDDGGEVYSLFVEVTAERNGYALWAPVVVDDEGLVPVEENEGLYLYNHSRENVLEAAVAIVAELQEISPSVIDACGQKLFLIDNLPPEEPETLEEAKAPEMAVEHTV